MATTNQYTDVSTGGSQTKLTGLKGLSSQSNKPKSLTPEEILELNELRSGASNPRQFSWTLTPLPEQEIGQLVGESTYDEAITSRTLLEDLNNARAELQPWWDQIGAGIAKMGVLAGTTFISSTVGLAAGAITSILEGRESGIWDNDVTKLMNNINKASEEVFKNYYTNSEQESPWYTNITTANFIGDKFLKNIGFTIGAIGAGALTGGLTSSLLAGVRGGAILTRGLSSVISAAGEASIEALNASEDYIAANNEFAKLNHVKDIINLNLKYADLLDLLDAKKDTLETVKGPDGQLKTISKKSVEFDNLHKEYLKEKQGIEDNTKRIADKIKEDALKVGNTTFGLNQLLLSASNNIQFGKILSGGYANAKKAAALTVRAKSTGEVIKGAKEAGKALAKGDLEFAAKEGFGKAFATKAVVNSTSEGFEEGAQSYISNTAQIQLSADLNTFAGAKLNPYVLDEVNSFLSAGNQTLQEQFGTIDSPGWEEVALGFLTGATGVPFFKKGKAGLRATWAGGIKEAYEETKEEFKSNDVVTKINELLQKPEFLNRYQGLIRHNNFQQLMDESLSKNNEFTYNNSEASQLVNDVLMFREAGQIDTLKEFFNTYLNLSNEDIEEIKKGTTILGTNTSIKGEELIDKTKKDITERAKKLSQTVDNILDIHDYHLVKHSDKFNKEGLEELTWMRASMLNHQERFEEKIKKFNQTLSPVLSTLDEDKLIDKDGNRITDLLNLDSKALFTTLLNKENNMLPSIIEALGKQKERYESVLKDINTLEKDKAFLEKKGKSNKAKKILTLLETLISLTKEIEQSGTLLTQEDLLEQFTDALASAASVINLRNKYDKAIKDPNSLIMEIELDKETSTIEASSIENSKAEQTAMTSENIKQLKQNLSSLNKQDRFKLLDKLSKQEGKIGQMSRDLKLLDTMHGAFGSLLDLEEFESLNINEKTAVLNAIDKAYNISNNSAGFTSNLQASVPDILVPTIKLMMELYDKSIENSKGLKDESPNPPTPPTTKVSTPNTQVTSQDNIEKKLNNPETLKTPEESNTKPSSSIDVSKFTYEDLFLGSNLVSEDEYTIFQNNPIKYNEIARKNALGFLTKSEEELFSILKLSILQLGMLLSEEEIRKEVLFSINYYKDKYKQYLEDNITSDNILTPNKAKESLDETLTALDNANNLPDSRTSIRSDAITEADIEKLLPTGEGLNQKGDRTYVPTANLEKYRFLLTYLENAGVFDFVNKGELAKLVKANPELKIHFIVDKTLNSYEREGRFPLQEMVLLAVETDTANSREINGKKYQIVGAIKNNNPNANNIVSRVIAESSSSEDTIVVSKDYSHVEFIYPGRIATTKGDRKNIERDLSFGDLATSADNKFHLGIMGDNNSLFCPTLDELDVVVPNNANEKKGRIYLMIRAADGKYYATPLGEKLFNKTDFPIEKFGDTPIFQKIKEAMKVFMDPTLDKRTRLNARDEFEKFVFIGKRIGDVINTGDNYRLGFAEDPLTKQNFILVFRVIGKDESDDNIYDVVKRPDGSKWTINLNGNFDLEFSEFIDLMDYINPRFLVSKKLITEEDFVKILIDSKILTTNLAALLTFNSNFTILGLDKNGKPLEKASTNNEVSNNGTTIKNNINGSPEPTIVFYNKTRYKVTFDGKILDEQNKTITDKQTLATINALFKLKKQEGILNKREGSTSTLYSLSLNGEEYGALVDNKTKSIKVLFGQEYISIINKFDNIKYGNNNEVKTTLDLTNLNSHIINIIQNGFDSSLYKVEIFGKEAIYIRVINKVNNEVLGEIPFSLTYQKKAAEVILGKELSLEEEFKLLSPIFTDMIKDNIDILRNKVKLIPSLEPKPIVTKYKKSAVNKLLDVKDSKVSQNNLEIKEKSSIFVSMSREDLKSISEALKLKNIQARTKDKIEEAVTNLLKLDDATLTSMSVDAIISKINCK